MKKFSFAALAERDAAGCARVRSATQQIRELWLATNKNLVKIGQHLLDAKADLPHGEWLAWLDTEFSMSARTAERLMSVGKRFRRMPKELEGLSQTALYQLAAPETPDEVVEEVAAEAKAGQKVTARTVKKKVEERKEPETFTLFEVSEKLGIAYTTLLRYKKAHSEKIPSAVVGIRTRYPAEALGVFQQIHDARQERQEKRSAAPGGDAAPRAVDTNPAPGQASDEASEPAKGASEGPWPDRFDPVMAEVGRIRNLERQIGAVRTAVNELRGEYDDRPEMHLAAAGLAGVSEDLANALMLVRRQVMPVGFCPHCEGEGCKRCSGAGWATASFVDELGEGERWR